MTGRRAPGPAAIFVVLALAAAVLPAVAEAQRFGLAEIPLVAPAEALPTGGDPLPVVLEVADAAATTAALPAELTPEAGDGVVRLMLAPGLTLGGEPEPRHREATFFVDFDEPEVRELDQRLVAKHGEHPDLETLRRFASRQIPDKRLMGTWQLASRVAREGSGDCTEHAVLLAALARARGYPARIVFGVSLVMRPAASSAIGHAWTEVHDGQGWRILDATVGERPPAGLYYLPLGTVDDESPSFQLAMMGRFVDRLPRRIRLDDQQ